MKHFSLLLLSIFFSFTSCKDTQELTDETIPVLPKAFLVMDMRAYTSAPFTIETVLVTKNKMSIAVSYSGGCEKHEFQLVGHKMITKSVPPERFIKLQHTSNGDNCRELIEEILVFNISDFAFGNEDISLQLDGYDKPILYSPVKL